MMEQRNQMLKELQLNKREAIGVVSFLRSSLLSQMIIVGDHCFSYQCLTLPFLNGRISMR